jgi:DNA-binding beta-propeller fold protein YncE
MTTLGSGDLRYTVVDNWAKKPRGWPYTDVAGVAVDSRDRVYLFTRSAHPVMVFDKDGAFVRSWGEDRFGRPHGIAIDGSDNVWCADDVDHTVTKFDTDGNLLMTLGKAGVCSDTGYTGADLRGVKRAGPPFNRPTKAVVAPSGDIYVSDGYGNTRVHRFSPSGELKQSWGEPGSGPGQFYLPHALVIDEAGKVYVADRQNNRIQVFSADGKVLAIWDGFALPTDMALDGKGHMYVAELANRFSICDMSGKILVQWGGESKSNDAGQFAFPHCIARDSRGVLYIGEVCDWNGWDRGYRAVQKFIPAT